MGVQANIRPPVNARWPKPVVQPMTRFLFATGLFLMGPTHLAAGRSTVVPMSKEDPIPAANWILHGFAAFCLLANMAVLGLTPCTPIILWLTTLAYHKSDP